VSAWSSSTGLTLGQIRTADKSDEITAIPELLSSLDIKGGVITIDAMGCQHDIANCPAPAWRSSSQIGQAR
jgi:hypothetical protein